MKPLLTLLLAAFTASAQTNSVMLSWLPCPSTNAAGTFIYGTMTLSDFSASSTPTNYVFKYDAGTNMVLVVSNLTYGLWYFTATAYCMGGTNESARDNIASWVFLPPPGQLTTRPN